MSEKAGKIRQKNAGIEEAGIKRINSYGRAVLNQVGLIKRDFKRANGKAETETKVENWIENNNKL